MLGWTVPYGIVCAKLDRLETPAEETVLMNITTIGLDIAKSIFQVHCVDERGATVMQRKLRRAQVEGFFQRLPPTLVGIEACGSAHYWARRLSAMGHEVRLMPPQYVKPYVKRNKTDARDAEAICEAVTRPSMRFVPIKSEAAQAARGLHRARDLLVRQRSQITNNMRGLLAEFGIVAAAGQAGVARLRKALTEDEITVPEPLRGALLALAQHWEALDAAVAELDRRILAEAKACGVARRLMAVPGVGPVTAHALVAGIPAPSTFRSGRDFAAWLGLTPRQNSSAERVRSGKVSRAGDGGLRRLLVLGAASLLRQIRMGRGDKAALHRLEALLARRPAKVAIVAQAARTARIVWAMLAKNTAYRAAPIAA
jgi:transposase